MADTRAFNPEDVNCFHGYEGKRFIIEWKTDEDGHCLPEPLRYIKTEVSPMFNGGYRFVFQGSAKAGKSYLFPHEILDIRLGDDASRPPQPADLCPEHGPHNEDYCPGCSARCDAVAQALESVITAEENDDLPAEFETLAKALLPPPDASDPTTSTREVNGWERRFETLMRTAGAPDLANIRDTAWGALNAVADYEQHHARAKGSEQEQLETLFRRSFLGSGLTSKAYELLAVRA